MFRPHPQPFAIGNVTLPEVYTEEDGKALESLFGPMPGQLLRGRFGVTHYYLQEPSVTVAKTPREVVMFAHGLGTNMHVYDQLATDFLAAGFSVLRYEYYNHGFSRSEDPYLMIGELVMVTQVEELLNHVLVADEPLHCFVGHSTGGVVAIQAARSLPNRKIDRLGLISPAVFANKPLIAQLADHFPNFMFNLMKWGVKPIASAVEDSYTKNCHIAFARDKKTKQYRNEAAFKTCLASIGKTFASHPFYAAGIMSISNFYLNERLLPLWREYHREIGGKGVKTLICYGEEDIVVPGLGALGVVANTTCLPLPQQGHESLYENTSAISPHLIQFFNRAS